MNRQQRNKLRALLAEKQRRQAEAPPIFVHCDGEGFPIDGQGHRKGEPKIEGGPVFMLDMAKMSGDNFADEDRCGG